MRFTIFYCEFCNYETKSRSKINWHHIVPKELGGSNKVFNRIYVCPTCHNLIYVPESKTGTHSIKTEQSIILLGWFSSTDGKFIRYLDIDGNEQFKKGKNN